MPTASTWSSWSWPSRRRFDVSVEETELEGIETIGQAFDLITAKL